MTPVSAPLWIGSPADSPHSHSFTHPASAKCGRPMLGMRQITDKQALVYLGNARCTSCFPGWVAHRSRHWGAA
jgi:hypothetical protein